MISNSNRKSIHVQKNGSIRRTHATGARLSCRLSDRLKGCSGERFGRNRTTAASYTSAVSSALDTLTLTTNGAAFNLPFKLPRFGAKPARQTERKRFDGRPGRSGKTAPRRRRTPDATGGTHTRAPESAVSRFRFGRTSALLLGVKTEPVGKHRTENCKQERRSDCQRCPVRRRLNTV